MILLGVLFSNDVDERVMELVPSVEQIGGRHGRPDVAFGGGVVETRLHRQLVIVQILHPVQISGFFLRMSDRSSKWKLQVIRIYLKWKL